VLIAAILVFARGAQLIVRATVWSRFPPALLVVQTTRHKRVAGHPFRSTRAMGCAGCARLRARCIGLIRRSGGAVPWIAKRRVVWSGRVCGAGSRLKVLADCGQAGRRGL